VGTKVSEAEFAMLEERARAAGLTLSEWVREALLSAPAESQQPGPESGEVALAEVVALRSLLLNLHFRAAKDEPVAGGGDEGADRAGATGRRSSGRGSRVPPCLASETSVYVSPLRYGFMSRL
jgi:hypothetical protein